MTISSGKRGVGAVAALALALQTGCSTPLHTWEVHTASTPRPPSLDVGVLTTEPFATFGLIAPPALQGLSPALSHALATALAEASPRIHAMPTSETLNRLNEQGLAVEYADLVSGFVRSRILERERLQRIAPALGTRYVLQPGLAAFDEALGDKFEVFGYKALKIRLTTLRLSLQIWEVQTGQMLWESWGEVTVAARLVGQESAAVSLDDIGRRLWSRIIQEALLGGETRSQGFFSN